MRSPWVGTRKGTGEVSAVVFAMRVVVREVERGGHTADKEGRYRSTREDEERRGNHGPVLQKR